MSSDEKNLLGNQLSLFLLCIPDNTKTARQLWKWVQISSLWTTAFMVRFHCQVTPPQSSHHLSFNGSKTSSSWVRLWNMQFALQSRASFEILLLPPSHWVRFIFFRIQESDTQSCRTLYWYGLSLYETAGHIGAKCRWLSTIWRLWFEAKMCHHCWTLSRSRSWSIQSSMGARHTYWRW